MTIEFCRMTVPESIFFERKAFKPKLKFALGDLVIPVKEEKPKVMAITASITYSKNAEFDYRCCRISNQGKLISREFWQKELRKIEK